MGIRGRLAKRIIGTKVVQKAISKIPARIIKSPALQKVGTVLRLATERVVPRAVQVPARKAIQAVGAQARGISARIAKARTAIRPISRFAGGAATAGLIGLTAYDIFKGRREAREPLGGTGVPISRDEQIAQNTGGAGMVDWRKLAAAGAGAGGLYALEQLAEQAGVRGGAGFVGDRPLSSAQLRRMTGFGFRKKQGLFNKRALKVLMKAKKFEAQAVKILGKRGLVFRKKAKGKPSLDMNEVMLARSLLGR